jgi:hypothetical protein
MGPPERASSTRQGEEAGAGAEGAEEPGRARVWFKRRGSSKAAPEEEVKVEIEPLPVSSDARGPSAAGGGVSAFATGLKRRGSSKAAPAEEVKVEIEPLPVSSDAKGPSAAGGGVGAFATGPEEQGADDATDDDRQSVSSAFSDGSDGEFEDSQAKRNCVSKFVRATIKRTPLQSLLFVIGLLLVAVAAILNGVDNGQGPLWALYTWGLWLCCPLFGIWLLAAVVAALELWMRRAKRRSTKYDVTVALYYMLGVERQVAHTLGALLTLVVLVVIETVANPPGELLDNGFAAFASTWYKLLGLLAMLFAAGAVATIARMWIAQDFGTRSYQARVCETLENEQLLCALGGVPTNPQFGALFEQRSMFRDGAASAAAANTSVAGPELWQRMMSYVETHHVCGERPAGSKAHEADRPGSDRSSVASVARQRSSQFFNRYWAIVERRRAAAQSAQNSAAREQLLHRRRAPGAPRGAHLSETNAAAAAGSALARVVEGGAGSSEAATECEDKAQARAEGPAVATAQAQAARPAPLELWQQPDDDNVPEGDEAALPASRSPSPLPSPFASLSPPPTPSGAGYSYDFADQQSTSRSSADRESATSQRRRILKEELRHALFEVSAGALDNFDELWRKQLDPKNSGHLSALRFHRLVEAMYKDRHSLSLTLQDSQIVITSIDGMIMALLWVLIIMVAMALWSASTLSLLSSMAASLVAWSFIFGESVKTRFNNLIFIFSVHPYDVSDRVAFQGQRYEVLSIRLLYTDFLRDDGAFTRIPNAVISSSSQPLYNYSTSRNHGVAFRLLLPATDVSHELMRSIREPLEAYVRDRPGAYAGVTFTGRELVHPVELGADLSLAGAQANTTYLKCTVWLDFARNNRLVGVVYREQSEFAVVLCETLKRAGVVRSIVTAMPVLDGPQTATAAAPSHAPITHY